LADVAARKTQPLRVAFDELRRERDACQEL
jgi:hypothetical protein